MTAGASGRFPAFALASWCLLAIVANPVPVLGENARMTGAASPIMKKPAKQVFGAIKAPISMKARAIGSYARGCLLGAQALPVNGASWQVMRTSRNRNWAHPAMISLIEKLATDAKDYDGWNGLLVGDVAQPRGGPMLNVHASHQMGLDADIWLTPMPDHALTPEERETMVPREMVKDPALSIRRHGRKRRPASSNAPPPIRKWRASSSPRRSRRSCANGRRGTNRGWPRCAPYYGHTYHFHVRIVCPKDSPDCKNQAPAAPPDGTGCGQELAYWMSDKPWYWIEHPERQNPNPPPPPPLSSLPPECRRIAIAP